MGESGQGKREAARVVLGTWSALGLLVLTLMAGIVVGRLMASDGTARAAVLQTDASPVGSPESEIDELNRLRTQVAELEACTTPSPTPEPTATPTPSPTPTPVPPVEMGTPVESADSWTVVVNSITLAPPIGDAQPSGRFVQVNVTVTNSGTEGRTYPFDRWILVDPTGRVFEVASAETTQVTGTGWYRGIGPSTPKDFSIVFDVATDSGDAFVLESRDDPTFRVALQIQMLG